MKWYLVPDVKPADGPFIKKVKVSGKGIVIVGYNAELYALGSSCPHAGAELSGGWCKDEKLICPFHRYSYDLKTGKGSPGQNDYIPTYPIKIREDGVYVGIETFWDKAFSGK